MSIFCIKDLYERIYLEKKLNPAYFLNPESVSLDKADEIGVYDQKFIKIWYAPVYSYLNPNNVKKAGFSYFSELSGQPSYSRNNVYRLGANLYPNWDRCVEYYYQLFIRADVIVPEFARLLSSIPLCTGCAPGLKQIEEWCVQLQNEESTDVNRSEQLRLLSNLCCFYSLYLLAFTPNADPMKFPYSPLKKKEKKENEDQDVKVRRQHKTLPPNADYFYLYDLLRSIGIEFYNDPNTDCAHSETLLEWKRLRSIVLVPQKQKKQSESYIQYIQRKHATFFSKVSDFSQLLPHIEINEHHYFRLTDVFRDSLFDDDKILFISGGAGAGKSTLQKANIYVEPSMTNRLGLYFPLAKFNCSGTLLKQLGKYYSDNEDMASIIEYKLKNNPSSYFLFLDGVNEMNTEYIESLMEEVCALRSSQALIALSGRTINMPSLIKWKERLIEASLALNPSQIRKYLSSEKKLDESQLCRLEPFIRDKTLSSPFYLSRIDKSSIDNLLTDPLDWKVDILIRHYHSHCYEGKYNERSQSDIRKALVYDILFPAICDKLHRERQTLLSVGSILSNLTYVLNEIKEDQSLIPYLAGLVHDSSFDTSELYHIDGPELLNYLFAQGLVQINNDDVEIHENILIYFAAYHQVNALRLVDALGSEHELSSQLSNSSFFVDILQYPEEIQRTAALILRKTPGFKGEDSVAKKLARIQHSLQSVYLPENLAFEKTVVFYALSYLAHYFMGFDTKDFEIDALSLLCEQLKQHNDNSVRSILRCIHIKSEYIRVLRDQPDTLNDALVQINDALTGILAIQNTAPATFRRLIQVPLFLSIMNQTGKVMLRSSENETLRLDTSQIKKLIQLLNIIDYSRYERNRELCIVQKAAKENALQELNKITIGQRGDTLSYLHLLWYSSLLRSTPSTNLLAYIEETNDISGDTAALFRSFLLYWHSWNVSSHPAVQSYAARQLVRLLLREQLYLINDLPVDYPIYHLYGASDVEVVQTASAFLSHKSGDWVKTEITINALMKVLLDCADPQYRLLKSVYLRRVTEHLLASGRTHDPVIRMNLQEAKRLCEEFILRNPNQLDASIEYLAIFPLLEKFKLSTNFLDEFIERLEKCIEYIKAMINSVRKLDKWYPTKAYLRRELARIKSFEIIPANTLNKKAVEMIIDFLTEVSET